MKWGEEKKIAAVVIAVHLLLLVYINVAVTTTHKKATKPLVIKTLAAAPQEKMTPPTRKAAPKTAVRVESAGGAKKSADKAPPIMEKKLVKEKKPSPAKKQPVEDKRERMSQKLLRDLEDSLAKLEAKPKKGKSDPIPTDLPAAIDALHLDATAAEEEAGGYDTSLIGYLKQMLNLPEYGEVKIQLTLKRDGSFVKLVVLKTESEKNRKYLEASLPHLRFPQLEGNKKQETFVVTFCNEL